MGISRARWQRAGRLATRLVHEGDVSAVAIAARHVAADADQRALTISAGQDPAGRAVEVDTPFLAASLTKPVVSAAALQLVEAGRLSLTDRVADWLPAFAGGRRRPVTVRHLLTHTSGLPEVWAANTQLRQAKSTREDFLRASVVEPLSGRAGRQVAYSSVGFSLLGGVLAAAGGAPLPELLKTAIFKPLGMDGSRLGQASDDPDRAVVPIEYPPDHEPADWDWNSRYWRTMGAPWGGLTASAIDLMTFLESFARGRIVSPAARDAAWNDHRGVFPDAGGRPWGLGWRFAWPGHAASFGDLVSADGVGHYGATGTLMWHDGGRLAVILTNRPAIGRPRVLQLLSNAVAAAFVDRPQSRAG